MSGYRKYFCDNPECQHHVQASSQNQDVLLKHNYTMPHLKALVKQELESGEMEPGEAHNLAAVANTELVKCYAYHNDLTGGHFWLCHVCHAAAQMVQP